LIGIFLVSADNSRVRPVQTQPCERHLDGTDAWNNLARPSSEAVYNSFGETEKTWIAADQDRHGLMFAMFRDQLKGQVDVRANKNSFSLGIRK